MSDVSEQTKHWMGEFGKEYTDRNLLSPDELESVYKKRYGVTRTSLNHLFLDGIDPSISVLEVGSNVGDQLLLLQEMGFKELHGVELQDYAAKLSRSRTRDIEVIRGTIFQIPCTTAGFELVFTSGLLIHIKPSDIAAAIREIYRCSRKYIWGFEYFADRYCEVTYRGHHDLLWKADFAGLYLNLFGDLELVKERRFKNLDNPQNFDSMFLLRKKSEDHG
jgi:pseudaminic acid biosynthesis-associated methylase